MRSTTTAARAGLPDATATFRWTVPDPDGRHVSGWRAQSLRTLTATAALGLLVVLLVVGAALTGVRRRHEPPQPLLTQDVHVDRELSGTNGPR